MKLLRVGKLGSEIVAALDNHGVRDINLDDYDVWSYIDNTKQGD